jgi:hypothetical protein
MSDPIVIKDFHRATGLIRVSISDYQQKKYIDIRNWVRIDDSEKGATIIPTKKGVTISAEDLEEFIKALEEAKKYLVKENNGIRQEALPAVSSVRGQNRSEGAISDKKGISKTTKRS